MICDLNVVVNGIIPKKVNETYATCFSSIVYSTLFRLCHHYDDKFDTNTYIFYMPYRRNINRYLLRHISLIMTFINEQARLLLCYPLEIH